MPNKTVLITGAATGIGRATALAFAQLGAQVFVNHCNQEVEINGLLDEAQALPGKLVPVEADVTSSHHVTNLFKAITDSVGVLDTLINNAGASLVKPFLATSEAEWEHIINTDLKSVFLCCQGAIPLMQKQGSGCIINVASELGFSGRANFTAYTAAKGAVITLTKSLALEFAPKIRVNGIAPGPTQTPLLEKENAVPGHQEAMDAIPMGRYGTAEEIAHSIVFLASDQAGFYCGEIICPTGGAYMR